MENFINYINGKKTYIICTAILIFNALDIADLIEPTANQYEAINYILVALGGISLRVGVAKTESKPSSTNIQP